MSNVLDHEKQQQILGLGRLGWTLRRIAAATGVGRETVSGYLRAAGIPVRGRGRPGEGAAKPAISPEVSTDSSASNPAISAAVSTDSARRPGARAERERVRAVSRADRRGARPRPQRDGDLAGPRRRPRLHRALRERPALRRGSCAARTPPEARVVITTAPGEEGQVDYGDGPMVRDPATGKYRRTRLFVLTLGLLAQSGAAAGVAVERADLGRAARARVSSTRRHRAASSSSTTSRGRAHARHLRSRAQSALSRRARALRRRRAAVSRRRSRSQRAKSKPASATRRRRRCKGLRFETLEAAQAYLDRWETHWADTRIHGTTKRQVAAMFAEEQPALGPLPLEPFRYYRFGVRTVHLDGCVEVEAAYYGAPPGWIGQRVQVQWNDLHVRLLDAEDRPAAARASARAARLASHRRRRSADAARRRTTLALLGRGGAPPAPSHQRGLRPHPSARGRGRRPPHPRRPRARQETRPRRRRGRRQGRARARRPDLSLPAPLSRAPPAGAAHAAPSRSAHPSAHPLPRSHRSHDRRPA